VLPQECLAALFVEGRKCKWITTNLQNIRRKHHSITMIHSQFRRIRGVTNFPEIY